MFHGLVFVVRPLFAYFYDFQVMYDAIGFQPTEWQKTTVLICTNLTLIVFTVVCMRLANDPLTFQQSSTERANRAVLLRSFWPWAIVIASLGLWAVVWGLQFLSTGSIDQIRQLDSRTGAGHLVGVNGYFISLPLMLASLGAIIVYLGRYRTWTWVLFGLYALLKLGTGGRNQVVTGLVMIALFYLFDHRRKWPGWAIVVVVAFGWMVFDQIGTDRGAGIRNALGMEAAEHMVIRDRSPEKPLETMDLANMEFFEYYVWAIPEKTGSYNYFVHNLQILTEPIPRALWPGKPIGPPISMYQLYRYAAPLGITVSVPGTGWAAMGFVGVVIWSALFALLYGGAYRLFARSSGGNLTVITYVVFASTSVVAFRDGEFITILKVLQFYFVPVLVLLGISMYVKSRQGPPAVAATAARWESSTPGQRRQLAAQAARSQAIDAAIPAADPRPLAPDSPRARRLARIAGG
jgi:hypothetical protein